MNGNERYIVSKALNGGQLEKWLNERSAEGYELVTFSSFGKTHVAVMKTSELDEKGNDK